MFRGACSPHGSHSGDQEIVWDPVGEPGHSSGVSAL